MGGRRKDVYEEYIAHFNLRHLWPSLFLFGLFFPFWCFSTLANYYLKVLFYLKAILFDAKNESKCCDVSPLSIKDKGI